MYKTPSIRTELITLYLSHVIAVLFLFTNHNPVYFLENLYVQIFILIFISLIISHIMIYLKHKVIQAILFCIVLIIFLVTGGLQGSSVMIEILLGNSLICLTIALFSKPVSSIITVCLLISAAVTQSDMIIFSVYVPAPSLSYVLVLEGLLILSALLYASVKKRKGELTHCIRDLTAREKTIAHLTEANRDFQKFALDVEEDSRLQERLHITREIHDITGYTLTSISMMLEHGEDLLEEDRKEELREIMSTAREQGRRGHEEIRNALKHLRAIIETREPWYLTIKKLLDNFQHATGVSIDLELTNLSLDLTPTAENIIYRFLQEGLTNAFRHGKATKVKIIFFQEKENIVISLEDNGTGSKHTVEGIGFQGMRERIKKIKGQISYGSTIMGFHIIVRVPISVLKGLTIE